MGNFTFGTRSEKELSTCNPQIVKVLRAALAVSDVDFGVVQGARTIEQQRQYFKEGHSKVNPDAYPDPTHLYNAAKHITGPGMPSSRAVDIIVAFKGKEYDIPTLCYLAGVILTTAKSLGVNMRSGINWDLDSEILTDQQLDDCVHFELT